MVCVAVRDDLKYGSSHEWVKVDGNCVTIGISDHALHHLGNVIFVQLPDEGAQLKPGTSFATVESMKSTSDVNSPISGRVVEVNTELTGSPGLVSFTCQTHCFTCGVHSHTLSYLGSQMD